MGHAHEQSTALQDRLTKAALATRERQDAAHADAERIKIEAIAEAATIVSTAQQEAAQHRRESEAALVAHTGQLRREYNMLKQRKESLLAQLNNLSSLANLTSISFAETDADDAPNVVIEGGPATLQK